MAALVSEYFDNPYLAAGLELTTDELVDFAEWHHGWDSDFPERREPPLWLYNYSRDGNVIRCTRPKLTTMNDATVIGDLNAPDCKSILDVTAVVGTTDTAPRTFGGNWGRHVQPWGDAIAVFLSRHPEQANKGGNALFFAEGQKVGKRWNGVDLCYKLEKKILRIHALAADIDGGCTVEQVIPRLRELGLLAVSYTTHSHTTKGGAGSDRFRIIIPLAEPFELGNRDDDPNAWEKCVFHGMMGAHSS